MPSTSQPTSGEKYGTAACFGSIGARSDAMSSRMRSICAECAASPTGILRACTPSAPSSPSSPSIASESPETTSAPGPFTAATTIRPRHAASRGASRSTVEYTEAMSPRPASLTSNALLHSAIARAPSTRDNAPETHAAAASPRLCPSTASGSTP
nr:hypothetical protein [Amycolatopsis sp. CA-230715]